SDGDITVEHLLEGFAAIYYKAANEPQLILNDKGGFHETRLHGPVTARRLHHASRKTRNCRQQAARDRPNLCHPRTRRARLARPV
ncbi:MAG: hypothetical protein WBF40_12300, partial [Methyloceanibacter sp.]